MELLGIPVWVFVTMMASSLILGLGIRFWLDRRDARRAIEAKERIKMLKKENRRAQKKAKKSIKSRKNKKADSEADSSGQSEPADDLLKNAEK